MRNRWARGHIAEISENCDRCAPLIHNNAFSASSDRLIRPLKVSTRCHSHGVALCASLMTTLGPPGVGHRRKSRKNCSHVAMNCSHVAIRQIRISLLRSKYKPSGRGMEIVPKQNTRSIADLAGLIWRGLWNEFVSAGKQGHLNLPSLPSKQQNTITNNVELVPTNRSDSGILCGAL